MLTMSDAEAAAERFFAGMSKPVPPGDSVLGAAQEAQESPSVSPPRSSTPTGSRDVDAPEAAARRFYGHQEPQDRAEPSVGGNPSRTPEATPEPPDGPDEPTIAELDEQRRQTEEARAERMFDLPMDVDNPRFDEPELDRFTVEVPEDMASNLAEGEAAQIGQAFVEAGLGLTTAASFLKMGIEAVQRGPMSPEAAETRNAAAMAELQKRWGDRTAEKLAEARAMISVAERRWPNIRDFLDRSGLGSDPKLIQQLVARAERRPGRKSR
jgi:hypothetical protein